MKAVVLMEIETIVDEKSLLHSKPLNERYRLVS